MARLLNLAASAVALLAVCACLTSAAPEADKVTSVPDYGTITSSMYAGYLNATDGRKAFYTFVESTGTPSSDPLVLWLNGGPGCSSMLGFFEENGPITMRHAGKFEPNAYAWNQLANVLYIESPGGVGFSIDTTPATSWDDDKAAAFNFAALNSFLAKFPEFTSNKMYLTGESYAGFYIPELAYTILTEGSAALKAQMQGYMVGNPCTGQIGCCNPDPFIDPFLQYNGFRPMQDQVPVDPNAKYDPYDLLEPTCATGSVLNRVRFPHPVVDALRKRVGNPPFPYGPCADDHVTKWLNRADVKAALHADPAITWSACSDNIQYKCNLNGVVPMYREMMKQTNWSILVYSGLDDSIVNQAQTQTIVHDMGSPLAVQQFQAWYRPDVYNSSLKQLGGFFLQYERISWAGVRNSGHMVPEYNPPSGLELFKSYLTLGRPGRLHD